MGSKTSKLRVQQERAILKDHTDRAKGIAKLAKTDPKKAKADTEDMLADFDKSTQGTGKFAVHYWTGMADELAMMSKLGHSAEDIADMKKAMKASYPGRVKLRREELKRAAQGKESKIGKTLKPPNPNTKDFFQKGKTTRRGIAMLGTLNKSKKIKGKFQTPSDVSHAMNKHLAVYGNKKASKKAQDNALSQYNAISTIVHQAKIKKEVVKAEKTAARK